MNTFLKSPAGRASLWFLMNGLIGWAAYEGVNGNKGCENITMFVITFNCLLTILALALKSVVLMKPTVELSKSDRDFLDKIKRGSSVPQWLSAGYDMAFISFLIYSGWWGCGIMSTIQTFAEAIFYTKTETKEEPQP
jgi:hypothetical protein